MINADPKQYFTNLKDQLSLVKKTHNDFDYNKLAENIGSRSKKPPPSLKIKGMRLFSISSGITNKLDQLIRLGRPLSPGAKFESFLAPIKDAAESLGSLFEAKLKTHIRPMARNFLTLMDGLEDKYENLCEEIELEKVPVKDLKAADIKAVAEKRIGEFFEIERALQAKDLSYVQGERNKILIPKMQERAHALLKIARNGCEELIKLSSLAADIKYTDLKNSELDSVAAIKEDIKTILSEQDILHDLLNLSAKNFEYLDQVINQRHTELNDQDYILETKRIVDSFQKLQSATQELIEGRLKTGDTLPSLGDSYFKNVLDTNVTSRALVNAIKRVFFDRSFVSAQELVSKVLYPKTVAEANLAHELIRNKSLYLKKTIEDNLEQEKDNAAKPSVSLEKMVRYTTDSSSDQINLHSPEAREDIADKILNKFTYNPNILNTLKTQPALVREVIKIISKTNSEYARSKIAMLEKLLVA